MTRSNASSLARSILTRFFASSMFFAGESVRPEGVFLGMALFFLTTIEDLLRRIAEIFPQPLLPCCAQYPPRPANLEHCVPFCVTHLHCILCGSCNKWCCWYIFSEENSKHVSTFAFFVFGLISSFLVLLACFLQEPIAE